MKNKIYILIAFAISSLIGFSSCEEGIPDVYNKEFFVEAYLIVDKPVEGIKIMNTQPYDKKIDWDGAWVPSDQVDAKIIVGDISYPLSYREDEPKGYYSNELAILPGTTYRLEIEIQENEGVYNMHGTTFTRGRVNWVNPPKDEIQYPIDSIELGFDLDYLISYNEDVVSDTDTSFYLISVKCLDTLEYGKYLTPEDPDNKNRRTYNVFMNGEDENYKDLTTWNFIASNITPTVWMAFKWFGKQEVTVWAIDNNMLDWMMQTMDWQGSGQYNDNLGSIEGDGFGVFGSAATATKECFLLKNQK